jgi:catechol 2,3-dioxygenase-like lactoylglutathione lyase family enzyme
MAHSLTSLFADFDRGTISRRRLLQILGLAAAGAPMAGALGQGRCRLRLGAPGCDTTAIKPVFDATGWRTVSLDHLVIAVADYRAEAAFYKALMGWTPRTDDGTQAVMDIGDWGTVILKRGAIPPQADSIGGGRGGSAAGSAGRGSASRAVVESFCWGITPWNARTVEADLRRRGLSPVAENAADGFESFHIKDPDGFDVQISNAAGRIRRRQARSSALATPAPFASTGWKTTWLDHLSFSVTDYKRSASFYCNLLGWTPTYDEGSQNECMIGDVGDIIIRGGNPLDPEFGRGGGRGGRQRSGARIDHISFGIEPWDTDRVKDELEKRGLRARVDTSTGDEIHVAAYKSYHTTTPNGFDLQISAVNHDTRLTLPTAVTPRRP